jgi:uncharacterized protein YcfL
MLKVANFYMDFALYWLDMVGIVMACLNYLTLVIFLRYFGHSKIIPCVIMDPFTKNHVESCSFHMGFELYWFDMVGIVMAHLNYLTLVIILKYIVV